MFLLRHRESQKRQIHVLAGSVICPFLIQKPTKMVKKIVSEYEKMCLENARRNEEILKNLGIQQCAQSMQHR